jgi:hypothetical protein
MCHSLLDFDPYWQYWRMFSWRFPKGVIIKKFSAAFSYFFSIRSIFSSEPFQTPWMHDDPSTFHQDTKVRVTYSHLNSTHTISDRT